MGIKTPIINEIAPDTYAINEFGLATMYLLVGEEKALLIDTGCGVCDLKSIVRSLTDKPLTVAITHGHMDHVGGMGKFDEVYLNEKDWKAAAAVNVDALAGYADSFGKAGGYGIYDYTKDDVPKEIPIPKFLPMNDGQCFELGNRKIEVYEIPGHTPGGCSFLDEKNRIIFSGDCCNMNLLAADSSVTATRAAIMKFRSLSDRFDQNFNGHAGFGGNPNCFSQARSIPDDLLHICDCILRGEGTPKTHEFLGVPFTQMQYGDAKLSYNPENL